MKLSIKKIHRAEIAALREQLLALRSELENGSSEQQRLLASQEKLSSEIEQLEKIDEPSDAEAGALATKRVKLEAVARKLEQIDATNSAAEPEFATQASGVLRSFARAAAAATGATVQAYIDSIAPALRPFTQDDAWALAVAAKLPAVVSLMAVTNRPWGQYGITLAEFNGAIAHADAILAGELAWTWDAKQKPA